jgi:hypothetical protein
MEVHGVEQGLHFLLFEVVDGFVLRTFEGEAANGLGEEQESGFLPGHEAEEGTDCCQSGIAGSGAAAPCVFHMIEEIQHERFVDVLHRELLDIFLQCI